MVRALARNFVRLAIAFTHTRASFHGSFRWIAIQQGRVNVLPFALWQTCVRGCWLQSGLQVGGGHGSQCGGGQHLRRHAAICARQRARSCGGNSLQSSGLPHSSRQVASQA